MRGSEVDLTPKEFAFLTALARHPGRVLTHGMLLREVWGPDYGAETQVPTGVRQPSSPESSTTTRLGPISSPSPASATDLSIRQSASDICLALRLR
jgi:hypothetical protein